MNIVNAGYASTNYYLLDIVSGKLMIDCGWPGTMPRLNAELKRKGISIQDIRYLLITHFHPDHAGLTQELKNLGVTLILAESQVDSIAPFAEYFRGKNLPYVEITQDHNRLVTFRDSRSFLMKIGLKGEILSTPGHSDDSITLVLDEGFAFTGDLRPRFMGTDDARTQASWERIAQYRITRIFPGHGAPAAM